MRHNALHCLVIAPPKDNQTAMFNGMIVVIVFVEDELAPSNKVGSPKTRSKKYRA